MRHEYIVLMSAVCLKFVELFQDLLNSQGMTTAFQDMTLPDCCCDVFDSDPAFDGIVPHQTPGSSKEEDRVSILVLLPAQFARRLNISLNRRTPVLDLIVYLSSLFRFNPADFVLGYANDDKHKGFRVLLPNSCIGSSGSSVLQLADKKHVMSTFFGEGACLRQTYNKNFKKSNQSKITECPAREQLKTASDNGAESLLMTVLLPDGCRHGSTEFPDTTLGSFFMKICRKNNLDPNKYSLQPIAFERDQNLQATDFPILTSNVRLGSLRNCRFLQMVPALKSCDLAESESSVDRMYKRYLIEQEQNDSQMTGNKLGLNDAVRALVSGALMPADTDGLQDSRHYVKAKTTIYDRFNNERHDTCKNIVDPMYVREDHAYPADGLVDHNIPQTNSAVYRFRQIFPQGQNSLDIPHLNRYKKQRAPLPPNLKCLPMRPIHEGRALGITKPQTSNDFGYMSNRSGRAHSVGSTMDDISEDFRQVIQIASAAVNICDRSTQTISSSEFNEGQRNQTCTDQQIQTTQELLTADDMKHFKDLSEFQSHRVHTISIPVKTCSDEKYTEMRSVSPNSKGPAVRNIVSIIKENAFMGRSIEKIDLKSLRVIDPRSIKRPDQKDQSTQSDGREAPCRQCIQRDNPVRPAQLGKKNATRFLSKIHGHSNAKQNGRGTGATRVAAILGDHDRLITSSMIPSQKGQTLEDPLELEVTEKTTTVECTVTVTAEGKYVSAVARPSTAYKQDMQRGILTPNRHVEGECYDVLASPPSPDTALGPRPYHRNAEFRKLDGAAPSCKPNDNQLCKSFEPNQSHTADAAVGTASLTALSF